MTKHPTATELRNMSIPDLATEIQQSNRLLAKLQMGVTLQKEKDTAKLQREKKHLARLKTVHNERKKEETALSKQEKQVSSSGKK